MNHVLYDLEPRPDTGFTNGRLGLFLILAAQVMLFGGLIASYLLLRTGAPPGTWPVPSLRITSPLIPVAGLALVSSALTHWAALAALRRGLEAAWRIRLSVTMVLGVMALLFVWADAGQKLAAGLTPRSATFWASWHLLLAVVALHLAVGVVAQLWLLGPGAGRPGIPPIRRVRRGRLVTDYWLFCVAAALVILGLLVAV